MAVFVEAPTHLDHEGGDLLLDFELEQFSSSRSGPGPICLRVGPRQNNLGIALWTLGDQLKGEECLKRRREEVLPKVVDEEIRILVKGTCETRVASVRPSGKPYAIQVINI